MRAQARQVITEVKEIMEITAVQVVQAAVTPHFLVATVEPILLVPQPTALKEVAEARMIIVEAKVLVVVAQEVQ